MTILWIPHNPWGRGASVRRDQHIIRHLKHSVDIIGVSWPVREDFQGLRGFWEAVSRRQSTQNGISVEHVRRLPDVTRSLRDDPMEAAWINEVLFRRDIRQIVDSRDIDVVITAYSGFMTGRPPFDLEVPLIFDYLDCSNERPNHEFPEQPYLKHSDGIMCVSQLALERAEDLGKGPISHIPNGVDVSHIRDGDGQRVRQEHGLEGKKVVSVIGPTRCDPPYYLNAVQEMPDDVALMIVGDDESLRREITRRESDRLVYVGRVPYAQVPDYYAASDVGLYPVDGLVYDDGRSPLKVFEYIAAGKPVVSAPIREVKALDFENVVLADPDAASFRKGIERALQMEDVQCSAVEQYDWKRISEKVLSFVRKFVE